MTEKNHKPIVDWERIEAFYRAGILSLRQICTEVDDAVTEAAIRKRAKRDGWTRDLGAKIRQRTEDLVRKEEVRRLGTQNEPVRTTLTPETEQVVVEANAQIGVSVRMRQRDDILRLRALASDLMNELVLQTANYPEFEELGELLRSEDDKGQDKRNDIYNRSISLVGRIDNAKKLAEILEKLQKMENEAYGLLPVDGEGKGGVEDLLRKLGEKGA